MNLIHYDDDIISLENLYQARQEFVRGKKHKKDVAEFALNLSANIYQLHIDLKNKTYAHGPYQAFAINDPKPRNIHKASVRDRLLHHAVYRVLYLYFDQQFVYDSYSCRLGKGTHKAIKRFAKFSRKVSQNNTKTCWVLKCDVRKFFASIDQQELMAILNKHEDSRDIIWLIGQVVESFYSTEKGKGLPLGNLTSQLLVNIYMNKFDQFVKQRLRVKYYIRYADDFVIMSKDRKYLEDILVKIGNFLENNLKLNLHPDKVYIKTLASGVDFLGWVNFPNHRVLRTATKRRMFKNLKQDGRKVVKDSYLGMLKHGNAYRLSRLVDQGIII